MKRYRVNADRWWILEEILLGEADPQEFNSDRDNLRGRKEMFPTSGRLTGMEKEELENYRKAGMIDYVVYSYATPIAYRIRENDNRFQWVVIGQRFSVTTSKHQGRVRAALHTVTHGS